MENTIVNAETSFRGIPIPELVKKQSYQLSDTRQVFDKILAMDTTKQKEVTIDSVHYDGNELCDVKLSTGDIVPVEAAIALADNAMLYGYRAGRNAKGDKTLKSIPSYGSKMGHHSIHQLPQF